MEVEHNNLNFIENDDTEYDLKICEWCVKWIL